MAPSTKASAPRRGGGVKGGEAAERSEGTLEAAEHRGQITCRRRQDGQLRLSVSCVHNNEPGATPTRSSAELGGRSRFIVGSPHATQLAVNPARFCGFVPVLGWTGATSGDLEGDIDPPAGRHTALGRIRRAVQKVRDRSGSQVYYAQYRAVLSADPSAPRKPPQLRPAPRVCRDR